MTNEEYAEVNSALDLLQEFDYVSWYQEAFGIVLNYIIKLEKEIENLQDTIFEEDAISRTEAIENFASWYGYDYDNQGYYRLLKQMPSVAPSYNSVKTELKPCEDCISREAIMDLIDEMGDDFYSPREAVISLDYMADAINELPSVTPQTRWIPISERLPENEQKVLFCTKQGNIHQGKYYAETKCYKWYSSIRSTWIYFDSILAWMPLPEPYEEGEK